MIEEPEEGVQFETVDGMFIKQITLPSAGAIYPQHSHIWDHSTFLARGRIILWRDKACSIHDAPEVLVIKAGVPHRFQTLSDNVLLYCLHNLHGGDAPKVLKEHGLDEFLDEGVKL
jgi:quercetin dioxygenase-like cupin family protein